MRDKNGNRYVDDNDRGPTQRSENRSRRSLLRSVGAAGVTSTFLGVLPKQTSALSTPGIDDSYTPLYDESEYQWYSPVESHWEGTIEYPAGITHEAAVSIRRTLCFDNVYLPDQGGSSNILKLSLSGFGLAASKEESSDDIQPLNLFGSDHTIGVTSNDVDITTLGTNVPRVAAEDNDESLMELPGGEGEWTTDMDDISDADIDVPNDEESFVLGSAGLAFGIVGTAMSGGAATLLGGTSAVLGAGSLISSMDDSGHGDQVSDNTWEYTLREEDGIIPSLKDICQFYHNLIIYITVDHGEPTKVTIYDGIVNCLNPLAEELEPWNFIGDNKTASWDLLVPEQTGEGSAPILPSPHDRIQL